MGLLLTILLPVAGMFVAIPLGIIMLFIMFSFPIILFIYFITKGSPMLAMILWGSLGFFIGFMIGIFVLVAVGLVVMGPIGLMIPMLLMAKSANPLRVKARNRTHARKKASTILGRDRTIVKVRAPTKSSDKHRVYHRERK
jgi:hypothetical protein